MPKWFKEAITDERGQQDIVLVLIAISVLGLLGLAGIALFLNRNVDLGSTGMSIGSILGLGSAGYGLKRGGEKYGSSDPCVGT